MDDERYIYSMTHAKHSGCVAIFYYNYSGELVRVDFGEGSTAAFKGVTGKNLPTDSDGLARLRKLGAVVKDISKLDLSFDKFWKVYAYKIGNKRRVMKLWKELPREDKVMALGFIRRMRNWYAQKRIDFPYPETYLNQRRWENEIPI